MNFLHGLQQSALQQTHFSIGNLENDLPVGNIGGKDTAGLVSLIVPLFFPLAGFALLLYISYGGFVLMTSQGSPEGMQKGKGIITMAIAGFFVVFLAYWATYIIGQILGLPDILGIFSPPV